MYFGSSNWILTVQPLAGQSNHNQDAVSKRTSTFMLAGTAISASVPGVRPTTPFPILMLQVWRSPAAHCFQTMPSPSMKFYFTLERYVTREEVTVYLPIYRSTTSKFSSTPSLWLVSAICVAFEYQSKNVARCVYKNRGSVQWSFGTWIVKLFNSLIQSILASGRIHH